VVDGVGGWSQSGVDPADFSHTLCGHITNVAQSFDGKPVLKRRAQGEKVLATDGKARLRPLDLLDLGYEKVMQDGSVWAGGSTACIATASSGGILEVAK
jgi:protein phosphatase PTC7